MDQIDDDLRLPDNPDHDFSEPDQVTEFEADRRAARFDKPNKRRQIMDLVSNPESLDRLKQSIKTRRGKLSVGCSHADCKAPATNFIHEQKMGHVGHTRDLVTSADEGGSPVKFACPEHTSRMVAIRNLARDMLGKNSASYYNAEPEDRDAEASRGVSTAATPIKDYIHLEDTEEHSKHTPVTYKEDEEDPREINALDHETLHDAYKDKLAQIYPKKLLEDQTKVDNAEGILQGIRNRIKVSQKRLKFGSSVRDLVTGPSGEPSNPTGKYADIARISPSRMKEIFGDPSAPEKSLAPGKTARSDPQGYTRVAGIGSKGKELNSLASDVDDLTKLINPETNEPDLGEYNEQGEYVESDYETYAKSFPKVSKYSKKTAARILHPVFKSPKWRLTEAGGTEHIRASEPADITARAASADAAKTQAERAGSSVNFDNLGDENEGEVEFQDTGPGLGKSTKRAKNAAKGKSTEGANVVPRHEITGKAQNDWDVRFHEGNAVLINENNRVVHAHFEPHLDENGEKDYSKGYWLSTGVRVRHATEPRYVSPEDVRGKSLSMEDLMSKAKEFANQDHSDCQKQYVATDGKKGHLINDEDGTKNCPKVLNLHEVFKAIVGPSGATRVAQLLAFNRRADVNPAISNIERPPARLRQAREPGSTFSHQPCYAKWLVSNGQNGHDNTSEDTASCNALQDIKARHL